MWFIHACLPAGPCQPHTTGELAEYVAGCAALFFLLAAGIAGLIALCEWLDGWLP